MREDGIKQELQKQRKVIKRKKKKETQGQEMNFTQTIESEELMGKA